MSDLGAPADLETTVCWRRQRFILCTVLLVMCNFALQMCAGTPIFAVGLVTTTASLALHCISRSDPSLQEAAPPLSRGNSNDDDASGGSGIRSSGRGRCSRCAIGITVLRILSLVLVLVLVDVVLDDWDLTGGVATAANGSLPVTANGSLPDAAPNGSLPEGGASLSGNEPAKVTEEASVPAAPSA